MGTNAVKRDATAQAVSDNVKRPRTSRNLGLRSLARELGDMGRPLGHSAVDQIEKGTRRVDVDDLMALAAVLNVSPATLLMPETTQDEWETAVDATGLPDGVTAHQLWDWLTAQHSPSIPAEDAHARDHYMWLLRARPPGGLTITVATPTASVADGND